MITSQFLLFLLLVALVEFGLKAVSESLCFRGSGRRSFRTYVVYRICTLLLFTGVVWALSTAGLGQAFLFASILTLVGSTELVASVVTGWLYLRTQQLWRPFHLAYLASISGSTVYIGSILNWRVVVTPGVAVITPVAVAPTVSSTVLHWILIYFLASIPANYVIRWLMNKPDDATLPDMAVGDLLLSLPIATPKTAASWPASSAAEDSLQGQRLRAGRVIGILERWMMLALMSRGELAAVGFVFTAKSIVRYREFERQEFAEYYLVGTLYSILVALALSYFL